MTRRDELERVLRAAELSFRWAEPGSGEARLAYQCSGRPLLEVSVSLEPRILRVVALGVLDPAVDAQLLSDRIAWTAHWRYGRIYYDPWARRWDAGVGVFAPTTPAVTVLPTALLVLSDAVGMMQAGFPPFYPEAAPGPAVLDGLARQLAARGLPLRPREQGGWVVPVDLPLQGARARVELSVRGALIAATAWPDPARRAPPTGETIMALNQTNAIAQTGGVAYDFETGCPFAFVAYPWQVVDADTLHWMTGTAAGYAALLPGSVA
jgi:hypothetical protein